jgi:two-component system chemotaxis sensor kinase CheA
LQSNTPAFQPTVHHLSDRINMQTAVERATKLLEHESDRQSSAMASQVSTLLEALDHANELITELEHGLNDHSRQATEDHTRLATVTDRLHDQVRRTRMLPLSTLFNPLRLHARDIARGAGKMVELELDDGDAEADRQVLERLREVLIHLIRNAVDHGIETPNTRTSHGKNPTGHIALTASVSGDYLTIQVDDDGAGIDLEAIKNRARSTEVLGDADIARLSDNEITDLIFMPGFSTRQSVSTLSGRGVGLDVVRSHVERMHGRVTVHSVPQQGCLFTLSVPLSLTSSHGLLLRIDRSTYMLPLDSVHRIVSVSPSEIQVLEGRACLTIDERPLALVHLADILGTSVITELPSQRHLVKEQSIRSSFTERSSSTNGGWSLALLLGSGERQIACLVDAVLGEQELVIYRLPAPLQRVRFIAGATILADGSVVPILDVVDVVRAAIGTRYAVHPPSEMVDSDAPPTILVVDDSITTRTLEKNILEAAGYHVHLATDGVEALETLNRLIDDTGCDLLLSDIDMPRLNGFDLTTQVRADNRLKHIPIVLVTSLDSPADRERGIAAGADAYIVKRAFDQQSLLDTIEQLI